MSGEIGSEVGIYPYLHNTERKTYAVNFEPLLSGIGLPLPI